MESLPDLIKDLPIGWQYTIAILVGLATIGISITSIIRWLLRLPMFRNLWPSMEDWTAICLPWHKGDPNKDAKELDAERPLRRLGDRWCQMRNMRKGDYYRIDMQKDRLISRVSLRCPHRYPKKYSIELETDDPSKEPELIGEFNSPIDYKFPKPRKFRIIEFRITEPDIPPEGVMHSWCVYEVRFWEKRIWGLPSWRIKAKR
jgi:hypothetical protein